MHPYPITAMPVLHLHALPYRRLLKHLGCQIDGHRRARIPVGEEGSCTVLARLDSATGHVRKAHV